MRFLYNILWLLDQANKKISNEFSIKSSDKYYAQKVNKYKGIFLNFQ